MVRKVYEVKYPNIEAERARNGMSVSEVAKAIDVSPYTYTSMVKGKNPITVIVLDRLCELYGGCDRDYLLQEGGNAHYGYPNARSTNTDRTAQRVSER